MTIPEMQHLAEQFHKGARTLVISEHSVTLWHSKRRVVEKIVANGPHITLNLRSLVGALYVKPTPKP